MSDRQNPENLSSFQESPILRFFEVGRVNPTVNPQDVFVTTFEQAGVFSILDSGGPGAADFIVTGEGLFNGVVTGVSPVNRFVNYVIGQDANNNGQFDTDEVLATILREDITERGQVIFSQAVAPGTYFVEAQDNLETNFFGDDGTSIYSFEGFFTQGVDNNANGDGGNPNPTPAEDQFFELNLPGIGGFSFRAPTLENSIITDLALETDPVAENELILSELPQSIEAFGTDAAFDNQMGLYLMVNAGGGVEAENGEILLPGDNGYAAAALNNAVDDFLLRGGSGVNTTPEDFGTTEIPADAFIGAFLISNGGGLTIAEFLTQNSNNEFGDAGDPVAYFSFAAANPDSRRHLRSLGDEMFGWEDLPNTGDADYNDLIFSLNFSTQVV